MNVFNEQHEMFRAAVRSFIEKEIAPRIEEWETAGRIPKSIWPRLGALGFLGVYPIERFARDVRLMTIGGGTSEIMREIIAKQLLT